MSYSTNSKDEIIDFKIVKNSNNIKLDGYDKENIKYSDIVDVTNTYIGHGTDTIQNNYQNKKETMENNIFTISVPIDGSDKESKTVNLATDGSMYSFKQNTSAVNDKIDFKIDFGVSDNK